MGYKVGNHWYYDGNNKFWLGSEQSNTFTKSHVVETSQRQDANRYVSLKQNKNNTVYIVKKQDKVMK